MKTTQTVQIERELFEDMIAHMELLDSIVTVLFGKLSQKSLSDWVDSEFVCSFLNIAPRTLRSYKEHGIIPFAKLGKLSRFKCREIDALVIRDDERAD